MALLFPPAFLTVAGLLALWIDVRFPKLAPRSLTRRLLAGVAAVVLLESAPLVVSSAAVAYATLFALVLPAFVVVFLSAVWILRALRESARTF
jgi:hypothetical protein